MNEPDADRSTRPDWERPGRFERAGVIPRPAVPAPLPPGWPHGVAAPGTPDFVRTAVAWLLDLCPPGYRNHAILRHHPALLARLARHHVTAETWAARYGYSTTRAALHDHEPPTVEAALRAYEWEGSRLAQLEREVALVERVLLAHLGDPGPRSADFPPPSAI